MKIISYTDVHATILDYSPWLLVKPGLSKSVEVVDGAMQGKALVALLKDIDDRTQAEGLIGSEIFIKAGQLPPLATGEYYWSDLIGLNVETTDGTNLGVVDGLLETGANDVVMVKGDKDRAIPFLQGRTIIHIDLAAGKMTVDWDPEF